MFFIARRNIYIPSIVSHSTDTFLKRRCQLQIANEKKTTNYPLNCVNSLMQLIFEEGLHQLRTALTRSHDKTGLPQYTNISRLLFDQDLSTIFKKFYGPEISAITITSRLKRFIQDKNLSNSPEILYYQLYRDSILEFCASQ